MRFRWNKPCAADGCWLTSPRKAAERGIIPEGIHAKAAESIFPVRFPAPDNAHPDAGVRTVPDGDGGVPGLGERAGSSFPLTVWRVQTLLSTDYRPPLTWTPKQARSSSQMLKSNSGASGTASRS